MIDVRKVYTTKEVADMFDISSSHLLLVSKELFKKGDISISDMRQSGKRVYLFNNNAINTLKIKFKK